MTPKEWAYERIGCGYIYGAKGQICSRAFRQQQAAQYPAQADNILNIGKKWDGVPVWECAQFTRYAWQQAGVELPSGATSQWNKTDWEQSGLISEMPETVCSVFRWDGKSMAHTGLYVGEGIVIHAKGTKYGVIKDTLTNYPWTHYGVPKSQNTGKQEHTEMETLYKAVVTAETGKTVNLRLGPNKSYKVVMAVDVGTEVDVYEETQEWLHVGVGKKEGWMMAQFLHKIEEKEPEEKEFVSIFQKVEELENDRDMFIKNLALLQMRIAALQGERGEG